MTDEEIADRLDATMEEATKLHLFRKVEELELTVEKLRVLALDNHKIIAHIQAYLGQGRCQCDCCKIVRKTMNMLKGKA